MSVQITIYEQKYFNQLKNDLDFATETTDFTYNCSGSVMEKIKFVQKIGIKWFAQGDMTYLWSVTTLGSDKYKIERQAGSFIQDGIAIGDNVDFVATDLAGSSTTTNDAAVEYVEDLYCIVQLSVPAAPQNTGILSSGFLHGKSWLTSLIYSYGLIPNDENFNVISRVSGNDQAYYSGAVGLDDGEGDRLTTYVDMLPLGAYRDWVDGTCRVKFIQDSGYEQQFEIEHIFLIAPWYLDGDLENLQNGVIREDLVGLNSCKYVYKTDFRTALSNPNTSKIKIVDLMKGSIGDFNENFNGYENVYSIDSVSYIETSTGNSASGLIIGSKTTVIIIVSKVGNIVAGGDEAIVGYVSYLPSENEYEDTYTDLETNFMYDGLRCVVDVAAEVGTEIIKRIVSANDSGKQVIEIDVEFAEAQQSRLSAESYFLIGILIGDSSLDSVYSNRVNLLADVNNFDLSADIPDLIGCDEIIIYQHTNDIII